ncbi:MAG TPA: kelch repeat-containing protein [Nocardioides sp.]|nr:kelch repeat-containing protein [Nocardioides sp.]
MGPTAGPGWRRVAAALALVTVTGCAGTATGPERDLRGAGAGGSRSPAAGDHTHAPGTEDGHGHDHDAVTVSDTLPRWEPVEGLYVPRDDFATAVVDGRIWAMGGMTGERGNRLTSIEVLDTATGRWSTSDVELPVGLASFEAVATGPRIWAFGGFDAASVPTDFAAVLDTRTGRWKDLPPLPHPRYAHTVTLHDGKIYVVGGRDQDGPVSAVDVFDPVRRTWTTADVPMPSARDSHDAVSTPDGLLVVGGWLGDGPTDRVDLYDPATGEWTAAPSLPVPMSRAGVAVADGRVWVSLHTTSYVLDVDERRSWEPANAISLSRHGLGYVLVDDALYAIGGCAENPLRDVRTVDRLTLA